MQNAKRRFSLLTAVTLMVLAAFLGGCSLHKTDTVPEKTPADDAVDVFELNRRLGRGVNLGNALEAPTEGEWGVTLQEEYFQLIKDVGFDAVRIPVRWSAHAAPAEPYTIDASFFERVDWSIDQALSRDLMAIINMHHYEEVMQDPQVHEDRFLAMWAQIADRYKDYPQGELVFELLNEPNSALGPSTWNQLLSKAIDAVRATNPDRAIVVGPTDWNSTDQLGFLELPDDDGNIIVTVHYYDPFRFTHQGAEWVTGSDPWLGTTWEATPAQEKAVTADFEKAASWGKKHNKPIYLGEFGAYSRADTDSRARWTSFIARQAEEWGLSWAYWEFGAGFGVYDRAKNEWNQPLLDALMPKE